MTRGDVIGLEWLAELRDRCWPTPREARRVYLRRALGYLREAREEIADGVAPEQVAKSIRTAMRYSRCAPPAASLPFLAYTGPRRRQLTFAEAP